MPAVERLRELLQVLTRIEKPPGGFSAALGLVAPTHFFPDNNSDTDNVAKVLFDSQSSTLTVRLPVLTENRLLHNENRVSLSTYLAILDDVTSWALPLADPKRRRMGVSVNLRTEWGPEGLSLVHGIGRRPGDQVDVIATVKKMGRNLGFIHAQVRDAVSGDLGFPLLKLYAEHFCQPRESNHDIALSSLFESPHLDSLHEVRSPDTNFATFKPASIHASLGGPIHGGCQAVVMELVAKKAIQKFDNTLQLQSISVDYLSSPNTKQVDLQVDFMLPPEDWHNHMTIPVRVQLLGKGKVKSVGFLHFSRTSHCADLGLSKL